MKEKMTELYISAHEADGEDASYIAEQLSIGGVKCFVPIGKSQEEIAEVVVFTIPMVLILRH